MLHRDIYLSQYVMLSPRVVSESAYVFLVLLTVVATGLSCAAILSQAVRTSLTRSWSNNFNALVVGASYIILVSSSQDFRFQSLITQIKKACSICSILY